MIRALIVFAIIGLIGYYGRLNTTVYTDKKEFEEEDSE